MPDPELTLKSTSPRMPRPALERERLTQLWHQSRSCALLLVTAPPGFGKTTLMLQWRMRWIDEGAAVAWYSTDASDDPVRFCTGIAHAARHATSGADPTARLGMEVLTELLAEIAGNGRETVLMIDDTERLPAASLPSLQYLLFNAPDNLHLVIGSRTPLALQTTELMGRGHVARIDADQLRFRLEESMAVLERQLGPLLNTDERARLHDATEGWPIGLQFAAAAIEHDPDPAAAIRSLSTRRTGMQDFFDALLAHIPEDMERLLTRVAILDNFNAELLQTITECQDAEGMIKRLAQALPVTTVGARHDWVRLHPLVRDFFRNRFATLPMQTQTKLHARASNWFLDHDHPHEAATHALAAGDETRALEYAARSLWALGSWGMVDEAREWLERIPAEMLASDTNLRMHAALILALGDRNEDALRMAQDVVADTQSTPETRVMALRVVAGAAAYADLTGLFPDIIAAWPDISHMDPLYAMSRANVRAYAALVTGQPGEAREHVNRALVTLEPIASLRLAVPVGRMLAGMAHLWEGNPVLAADSLAPVLRSVEGTEGRRSVIACAIASILAAAWLQMGRADAARAVLANRLDVIERCCLPDNVLMAYRTLAHIALRRDDTRTALSALTELDALGVRRKLPRLRVHSLAERIRIHAREGRNETSRHLVRSLGGHLAAFEEGLMAPWRPHVQATAAIATAHAAIARGALDEAARTLESAAATARDENDGRDIRTILALQAVVAHERGDVGATAVLREALHLAKIAGDDDFLAQVHPIAANMAGARDSAKPPRPRKSKPQMPPRDSQSSTSWLLTSKEVEVLHLLEQGMSNKRIASALDVTVETVKWHIKNLLSKLTADSRTHAVSRARLLGLLR